MNVLEWVSALLVIAGAFFFLAGTAGLLRFPDVYTRLHALTKADNIGLGLSTLGLMLVAESPAAALKILLVWLVVLPVGATAAYLIAGSARREGIEPEEHSR